ncbi:hypothetical protein AK812_SmicGene6916 [Symbiodinium microadriaticum]|uniref:Methyltransferase FkbM domain-containing protein n=1 Tax=Symbiodinium microadriaticum TaxID=2951 RepID=A0A1Q9EPZ1_SYMMI|nr:hypothetical protein AK812_SmicGene6916 [Symbiodinium microadriaticum]
MLLLLLLLRTSTVLFALITLRAAAAAAAAQAAAAAAAAIRLLLLLLLPPRTFSLPQFDLNAAAAAAAAQNSSKLGEPETGGLLLLLLLLVWSRFAANHSTISWIEIRSDGAVLLREFAAAAAAAAELQSYRTGDASFLCPAAAAAAAAAAYQCVGPIEDGDVCVFCAAAAAAAASYQEAAAAAAAADQPTFLAKYGYERCYSLTGPECCCCCCCCCRCLHDAPPVIYHELLLLLLLQWAQKPDKPSIHSAAAAAAAAEYTEVLTWGTDSCTRGVNSWYQEIGVHNFSIPALLLLLLLHNSGHMVILLWHNAAAAAAAADNTLSAPIVVCDCCCCCCCCKGPEAWEANLKPRLLLLLLLLCRDLAIHSTGFPAAAAAAAATAEEVALLRTANGCCCCCCCISAGSSNATGAGELLLLLLLPQDMRLRFIAKCWSSMFALFTRTHSEYTCCERWGVMASALRAVNFLEGLSYPHHPVFMQPFDFIGTLELKFPSVSYPVSEDFLVELGGLRVPIHLDCDRNRSAHWNEYGCMNYFYASPGRWTNCYLHEAYVHGGMPYMEPSLPIIDEEYSEYVAVYQAILRARGSYVMAELGARWGTWGARAAAALALLNPMPYVLHFVESDPTYCRELSNVMALNRFSYSLDCDKASHEGLAKWILSQDHVDLLDLDVQGAEKDLMSDPALLEAIASKVYRLVIGTHSPEIHAEIVARFGSWIVIYNMPYAPDKQLGRSM